MNKTKQKIEEIIPVIEIEYPSQLAYLEKGDIIDSSKLHKKIAGAIPKNSSIFGNEIVISNQYDKISVLSKNNCYFIEINYKISKEGNLIDYNPRLYPKSSPKYWKYKLEYGEKLK